MRTGPAQLTLDLAFRPASGRDDFLVGSSNREAVDWIDRYPGWPGPVSVLCGPSGSGKSHLLAVWSDMADSPVLDGADLYVSSLAEVIGDLKAVAVDAADRVAEPDCLFHLVNMMRERDGYLLIAVREPPARWRFGSPDMRSRLAAAPLLVLGSPDDVLLQAVLLKQFDDRRLLPDADILTYLVDRMPRTFDAVGRIVGAMDRLSLATRRGLTKPIARTALQELGYLDAAAD